tara:strand:- start:1305 stop:2543 length:1239 start_codon:yes stop_codon:yes gene_type:complete
MKHFLVLKCLLLSTIVGWAQTCDIELVGYTPPASENGLHTFVVNFTNTENCGCNEFTQFDGNNCDESTSSHVNNNETVSHIVFGIHYVDEETGEDYGENTDCTSTTFHPGWSYVLSSNILSGGWSSGSSSTFAINPPFSWDCILENPIDGYCWEVVIWQINLSQTADYEDFPDDGWSNGNSFNSTQTYPDTNLSDNRITFCPEPTLTDTIYITDTLYVDNFIYDTIYVELPADTVLITEYENVYITDTLLITEYENVYITDTLYIDNFIFDTTYVEVVVDNYIYVTDTITEYILEQIYIDCETGLECTDEPIGFDCESTTLYAPNTFTPNNDGVNDVWKIVYESTCWKQIDFTIYNRWGNVVFRGADDEFWDGSMMNGDYYVADGVYTYTLVARRRYNLEYLQSTGTISVFR